MLKNYVCSGIVTYNPDIKSFRANVINIASQVHGLVVVDNNSENVKDIEIAIKDIANARLIKNKKNYGMAKALNQILEYADANHYKWYLTLDQDSVCCEDLIKKYADVCGYINDNVAVLCPFVLNNNKISLEEYRNMNLPDTEEVKQPIKCITSASLNLVDAAKAVGGYAEELFIDCVDVEFNIRLLEAGYKILKVNKAYIIQSMGTAKRVSWIDSLYKLTGKNVFKKLRYTPVYNNTRLYYIARNSKYVYRKYGNSAGSRMTPKWMFLQFIYYSVTYPLSCHRFQMWRSIYRGWKDANALGGIK